MKFAFKPVLMAALLAAGVVSGSHAVAADDGLARIKASDRIRIGVFGDKPPFGYIDSEGKSQGFDVEIAKDFAKDLLGSPDKVEYVITEAANRVEYLKSGKVDIILANFTQTKERARVVDFAAPYMKVSLGVVSPTKAPIKSVDELEGKTLLVNKGTVEGYHIVTLVSQLQVVQKFVNTCDRAASCNHDFDTSFFGILDGRKDLRSNLLLAID